MDFILLFVVLIFTDDGTLTDFVLVDLERYGRPDGQKRQKREATGLCLWGHSPVAVNLQEKPI